MGPPIKHDSPDKQRLSEMIRFNEARGLKAEQKFDKFIFALRKVRTSSSTLLKELKKKPQSSPNLRPKTSPPKIRKQDAEYEHLITQNPHETDAGFTFTKNAQRAIVYNTKQHMLQVVSNIKHEIKNPDQVIKYLTGNPVIYTNLTERKVNVIIREFPNKLIEREANDQKIVEIRNKKALSVMLLKTRDDGTTYLEDNPYVFNRVYEEGISNNLMYAESVSPVVSLMLTDLSRCAMCVSYGQRMSGKSYSLFGANEPNQKPVYGAAHLAIKHLLEQNQKKITIAVSFYEVYLGKIYDLLNNGNDQIHLREVRDKVVVEGLSQIRIRNFEDCCKVINKGMELRNDSLEHPNEDGSRSFLVLLVKVKELALESKEEGNCAGQIAFVDMAAFERAEETLNHERPVRMLAHDIKRTLQSFLVCTRNIEGSKKVPPYRESRLNHGLARFLFA